MALYYLETRLRLEEDTHIEQVVLYLGKEALRMRSVIETPSMRFQFRLIDIGELDGDALAASGDLGDVMLAVLARVTSRQEAIRRALDRIAKLKRREREVAVEQLAILAGLWGLELELVSEAREYMPFVVDLMENRIFRQRYERGLAEGEARGETKELRPSVGANRSGKEKSFRLSLRNGSADYRHGHRPASKRRPWNRSRPGVSSCWTQRNSKPLSVNGV
jgi:hypothetical protein